MLLVFYDGKELHYNSIRGLHQTGNDWKCNSIHTTFITHFCVYRRRGIFSVAAAAFLKSSHRWEATAAAPVSVSSDSPAAAAAAIDCH